MFNQADPGTVVSLRDDEFAARYSERLNAPASSIGSRLDAASFRVPKSPGTAIPMLAYLELMIQTAANHSNSF